MADGSKLLVLRDPGDLVENTSLLDGKADRETGFVDQDDSTISFVDGTRTFTITPASASFEYFQNLVRYTQVGADSVVTPDTEGLHFVYYDGADLKSTAISSESLITLYALVAVIYWDATNGEAIIVGDERHGNVMDSTTHLYNHSTFGTRLGGGLTLGNMNVDGSGNDASAAQFSVSDGSVWDEDLTHTITNGVPQTLSAICEIPMFYRTGAAGEWRRIAATQFPIVTTGSGRAAFNELTGGAFQLSEVDNNDYVLTTYYATGDVRHPVIGAIGQASYNTVSEAREGALVELQNLGFGIADVLTPEFLPFATVIWQTANSYSNVVQSRVRSTDTGDDYIDWRVTRGSVGAGGGAPAAPVFLDSEFKLVDETNLFVHTRQLSALTADREVISLDAAGVDALSDAVLTAESIPFIDSSGRLGEDTAFVRDAATGNVGINQSNPDASAKLEVGGQIKITGGSPGAGKVLTDVAGSGLATWVAPAASAGGWTDDGSVVRLTTVGDQVGIGTASPDASAKLEVGGQIKITGGSPGAGKVLTDVAGTGLATWASPSGGSGGGWTDDGTVVRLTTATDQVGIGTATPTAGTPFEVVKNQNAITWSRLKNTNNSTASQTIYWAASDAVNTYLVAHATARTATRHGVTVGAHSEILSAFGDGLLIGTAASGGQVVIGTEDTAAITIDSSQDVGVGGAPNSSYVAYFTGDVGVTGTLTDGLSDARAKTDMQELDGPACLQALMLMRPVDFTFLAEPFAQAGTSAPKPPGARNLGFVAQDIAPLFPSAVFETTIGYSLAPGDLQAGDAGYRPVGGQRTGAPHRYFNIRQKELIPPVVAAMQEIARRADDMEKQLRKAEKQVRSLEAQMAQALARIGRLETTTSVGSAGEQL